MRFFKLAVEAAQADRGRHRDGVWLVELGAIRHDAEVPRALADAFGIREAPGFGVLETAVRHIGDRRVLIVLDNCEHVAIGSDFEGDIQPPPELADVQGYQRLARALEKSDVSKSTVEAIFSKNALRVLCRTGVRD